MRREVVQELDRTGLPWRLETRKKHDLVYLGGRMIAVLPRSTKLETTKGWKNTRARIRRAAKEMTV